VAAWDGAHQCIGLETGNGHRVPVINEPECVGCNLCALVCPVDNCIQMVEVSTGKKPMSWREYQAALSTNPKLEPPGQVELH
jgi:dihydropyrimidine dehydrogenase (NAD+) subunit PreA